MSRQFPNRDQLYFLESPLIEVVSNGPMVSIRSEMSRSCHCGAVEDVVSIRVAQATIDAAMKIRRFDVLMMATRFLVPRFDNNAPCLSEPSTLNSRHRSAA